MINKPTCYKNPDRPSNIDLILINCPHSFQNFRVIETGLSDFHKMVLTVMKTTYRKPVPRIEHYRDFKYFCHDHFKESDKKLFHNTKELDVMKFISILQSSAIKFLIIMPL